MAIAAVCAVLMGAVIAGPVQASGDDYQLLLDGVDEIAAPGVPGPLCVYGDDAFAVAVGGSTGDAVEPAVAAGRLGAGRVIVFGHGGYLSPATLAVADTATFMVNAVRWAGGGSPDRVAVVASGEMRDWLNDAGFDARSVDVVDLGPTYRVAVVSPWSLSDSEIDRVQDFVRQGGGMVTAATGWGWAQLNPDKSLTDDFPGNMLLRPLGIQYPYAWLERTTSAGYRVDGPPSELTNAGVALDALLMSERGGRELTKAELEQASVTLLRATTCVPQGDTLFRPRLDELLGDLDDYIVPSPQNPVTSEDALDRVALSLQLQHLAGLPPEQVPAHPASELFPGPVPEGAPRVRRDVVVDTSVPRWHSTGLYAAPGEVVEVRVPASATDLGLSLRIGAHTDKLWSKASWRRVPEIAMSVQLESVETRAASPFGGLLFIDVPVGASAGRITLTIAGAVEAPLYVHGETDLEQWRSVIRHRPAPWAEVASRTIVVTVPSSVVRDLDDPGALMDTWDRLQDLNAELAAWPKERTRPERFVVDEQISAGYMHAGYPIMAHLDQQRNVVSREHLLGGNWGIFHELGHNHQSRYWTFVGTTEVTVNLFTLHAYEFLCGVPVAEHPRGNDEFLREQMAKYDFEDPDFDQWKRDPFLALAMYVQLQRAFGWDTYKRVFAEYRALSADELPKTDDEERDQWLVRFSRAVGRDLGPFFEAWGVPTSSGARESISDLPVWMPEGFPPGAESTATATPPTPTETTEPAVPTSTAVPTRADAFAVHLPLGLNVSGLGGSEGG